MIDHIRSRRRQGNGLHPADRHVASQVVVGGHASRDTFKPPHQIANIEEQQPDTSTTGHMQHPKPPAKKTFWERLKSLSKKQWLLIGGIALIIIGGSVGAFMVFHKDTPPPAKKIPVAKIKPEPTPTPTTVPNTLTGRPVDPGINDLPVTAVMIENSTDARPQAGLYDAGVVFEAVAEGGITRFLTLFQDTAPEYIGPVRSVRPYYIQWALGFDAAIAHAGGSAEALALMTAWKVKDLNHNANYFWRVNNRTAPHNLYTSMSKLHAYQAAKGYGKSNFTGFVRKAEKPSATPNARTINFAISSANFAVGYDYNAPTNSYLRSEGGQPHNDEKAGRILPKVVIALIVPQSNKGIYTVYGTMGTGKMYVFQDGVVQEGTWRKDNNISQFVFTDAAGAPLALNPGQTWLTILGSADKVTFTP